MDGEKWDGVPVPVLRRRTFPGAAHSGAVSMLGHSIHAKTVGLSAVERGAVDRLGRIPSGSIAERLAQQRSATSGTILATSVGMS